MADEKIRIDLEAKDDASKVIDQVADKAEELERVDPEVEVAADTGRAEADLDAAAAKARELDQADVEVVLKARVDDLKAQLRTAQGDLDEFRGKAQGAAGGVRDLGDASDQSRSVMANLVGNTTQDLGALGGVAGSAGVAIGQLAEYAADGNIALKNLAGLGVGLGAVMLVSQGIAQAFGDIAEAKAFRKEQVDSFVAALEDGSSAAEAMAESFRDAGKVEFALPLEGVTDISEGLAEVGLNVEDFTRLAAMSNEEIGAWGAQMRGAGADTDTVRLVMLGAAAAGEQMSDAQGRAALNAKLFGEETSDAIPPVRDLTSALEDMRGELDQEASLLNATESLDGLEDAMRDAWLATTEFGAGSEEAQDANRDLQGQLIDAKRDVIDYAEEVGGIPRETITDINAAIDRGDLAGAERLLNEAARDREAVITPKLKLPPGMTLREFNDFMGGRVDRQTFAAAAPAPAPAPVNVTMNLPVGITPRGVMDQVEGFVRRNGGRVR